VFCFADAIVGVALYRDDQPECKSKEALVDLDLDFIHVHAIPMRDTFAHTRLLRLRGSVFGNLSRAMFTLFQVMTLEVP